MTSTPLTRRRTGSDRGRRRDILANRHVPTIIGILAVITLAVATIITWWLPGSRWSAGPVVVVVPFLLALGWPTLACLHMPWLVQAVLALGGTLTPLGIVYRKNLDVAVPLTGITLAALVVATILDAPAPRDHSVGRTNEHWGSTALSAALAPSMTCLLTVTSGSMWVSLTVREHWPSIVPMAAPIAVIGVVSARFGYSAKVGAAFVMIAGPIADPAVTSIAWSLEQISDLPPVVFSFIAKRFGEFVAFLTLGGATGFGVGFAVSVVDALLRERASSAELANILGRGAAKLLVVALPVYTMICIGGI